MNEGILIQIGKSVRLDHTLKKTGISNFKININAINFKHSTLVQESIDGIDDFTQWEHSKEDDMTFFVDPRVRLENEIASFNHRILILILIILLIITTVASGILTLLCPLLAISGDWHNLAKCPRCSAKLIQNYKLYIFRLN